MFWCEGEKDADTVTRLGVCGTSHPDGAMKVRPAHAAWLRGHRRRVFLLVDRDAYGAVDVQMRYAALRAAGISARQMRLMQSPFPGCKDVTDHVLRGHSLGELVMPDLAQLRTAAASIKSPAAARRKYLGAS